MRYIHEKSHFGVWRLLYTACKSQDSRLVGRRYMPHEFSKELFRNKENSVRPMTVAEAIVIPWNGLHSEYVASP